MIKEECNGNPINEHATGLKTKTANGLPDPARLDA